MRDNVPNVSQADTVLAIAVPTGPHADPSALVLQLQDFIREEVEWPAFAAAS